MEDLIIELLHEILGNLEPHDLLSCRLVNREWNYIACKYLKLGCKPIVLHTDAQLQKFMATMEVDTQSFPYSRIHMSLSNLIKENVELFSSTFGLEIIEYDLDLDFTGSTSTITYYDAVEKVGILLENSPHLEILRIKDENIEIDFSKFKFEDHFPLVLPRLHVLEIKVDQLLRQSLGTKVHFGLLHQLIKITPALQHFIINFVGNGFWNCQLSNLLKVMQDVPRISLINLSILTEDVRRGNIQSLVAIKCQIQELSLVLMDAVYNPQLMLQLLYDWLEIDGQTLTKLRLTTDNIGFCLPILKNLDILELNLNKKLDKDHVFLQRFQSEQFPNLHTVHLKKYSENYQYFTSGVFPTVTSLILDSYQEDIISERWDQSFPNLNKLELLNAIPNHLASVFMYLNYVKTLKAIFNSEKTEDFKLARILNGLSCTPPSNTNDSEMIICSEPIQLVNGNTTHHDTNSSTLSSPSLQKMNILQNLEIGTCGKESLAVLVQMSSENQIRHLRSIKITTDSSVMNLTEIMQVLLKFHSRVQMINDGN